jgi:hypothetical protein
MRFMAGQRVGQDDTPSPKSARLASRQDGQAVARRLG